ncbi:SOUL family heme-binding protein [Gudongella sp. DL1XJH-153]|uniref:SOUL family heme-binding protein n=1 Tax=Gudongella sp. DL1XJH-153 TaxID=3409804 RepID=UPI003BB5F4DC
MGIYESPQYEVVKEYGDIEIRKYESYNLVTYENPDDRTSNEGFSNLFLYISKGNEREEKISMTVPVIDEKKSGIKTMSFVVPSKFNQDEIPLPNSDFLSIKTIKKGYFAVIRFRGNPTEKKIMDNEEKLKKFIEDKGYKVLSNYYNAFYDPPFQLPFIKKSEIMVRIEYTV